MGENSLKSAMHDSGYFMSNKTKGKITQMGITRILYSHGTCIEVAQLYLRVSSLKSTAQMTHSYKQVCK